MTASNFSRYISKITLALLSVATPAALNAQAPAPALYVGAPVVQASGPDWSGAQWISGCGPNEYAYLRKEFSVDGSPTNAILHVYGGPRHRVFLNGVFVGSDNRSDEQKFTRSYNVTDLLNSGSNTLAIIKYATSADDLGVIAKLMVDSTAAVASDGTWKFLSPNKVWQNTGLRVSQLTPMEVYDPAKAPVDAWMQSGFDAAGWETVSVLNQSGEIIPDPYPEVIRSFVLPANMVWAGERIRLDEHERIPRIALYMAYEPMQPFRFGQLTNPEALLSSGSEHLEADLVYPYNANGFQAAIADGNPPASVSPTLVLDFGRVVEGYFFVDIEADGAGPFFDVGFSKFAVDNQVIVLPHDSGKDPQQGNQAHRVILPKGRVVWQGFHTEPVRYVNLSFRNLGNRKVKVHSFGIIEKVEKSMTKGQGATVIF